MPVIVAWLNVMQQCNDVAHGVAIAKTNCFHNAVIISRRVRDVKCNFPRGCTRSCAFFITYLHKERKRSVYNVVISRNARNEKCNFLRVSRLRSYALLYYMRKLSLQNSLLFARAFSRTSNISKKSKLIFYYKNSKVINNITLVNIIKLI